MNRFSKLEVLNMLELSRKRIRTFKSVRAYILAVIDNRICHIGQFELKMFFLQVVGFFFHWNDKGCSKRFIFWVILRHGNVPRMKFYLTLIIHGDYLNNWQIISQKQMYNWQDGILYNSLVGKFHFSYNFVLLSFNFQGN